MANYTITLNELLKLNPTLRAELFPDWTIFDNDETHKTNLENDIVDYFLLREIGFETADAFVHYFQRSFKEHIAEYNRLGAAQAKVAEIGWFSSYDEHRTLETNVTLTDTENKTKANTQTIKGTTGESGTETEVTAENSSGSQNGETTGENKQTGSNSGTVTKSGNTTNEQETTDTNKTSGSKNNTGSTTGNNDNKN